MRELLVYLLNADPRFEVVGIAGDGVEAIAQTQRLRPDVITMDLHLPNVNGVEATRTIMETQPTPIVVVSNSSVRDEIAGSFAILEAGALAMVDKPAGIADETSRRLLETVRLMAEVKVVRRWPRVPKQARAPAAAEHPLVAPAVPVRLVAMGASTGGPMVLKTILGRLTRDFPVPVVITQHISPGFCEGFAQWLGSVSGFPTVLAAHGETLKPGRAYVAPDGAHLCVELHDGDCRAVSNMDPPEGGHRPAVSYLFRSAARSLRSAAVGVLLTGMGRDGAAELKLLRDLGATTIAQAPETAVVPGMPGEAIDMGAAMHVLPPECIADMLKRLVTEAAASRRPAAGFTRGQTPTG